LPILPADPAVFPDDLFDGFDVQAADRAWWALHIKPRQEKRLARELRQRRCPYYLPLVEHRTLVRGKVVPSFLPLFPGYVFLLADPEERVGALTTNRIVRSLEVADQAEMWHDLGQVARLIATGRPVTAGERLVPGAPVEIHSGPLAGLRGVVDRTASGHRFWVRVNFLHRGASVLLDDCVLTPVADDGPKAAAR
jgi:transcription antitermination factor NusG